MKTVAKLMGGVLLAGAALAAPVQAQVSYTTTGAFTGGGSTCNNPIFATIATCTFGGFTLTFNSEQGVLVGDGGVSSLGNFTLAGSGNVPAISPSTFFAIMISQTAPSVGTGITDGFISGSVRSAPPTGSNFSSLMWVPDQFVNINATTYRLIFDNVGPAANVGMAIPLDATRGIQVQITTTPEPASMALLATGLVGIFGVVRRRRKAQTV